MREDFFEKIVIFSLTQKSYYSIILLVFDRYILCDSGVVGNARPCQGRDRGFEPRLSLSFFGNGDLYLRYFFILWKPYHVIT